MLFGNSTSPTIPAAAVVTHKPTSTTTSRSEKAKTTSEKSRDLPVSETVIEMHHDPDNTNGQLTLKFGLY